jgi:hypothetical protein
MLKNALSDPNRLVIMTFNTNKIIPWSGHAMVLVAYKSPLPEVEDDGFGFLNSGWRHNPKGFTWQSQKDMFLNILSPLPIGEGRFLSPSNPHFVSVSKGGGNEKQKCPIYPYIMR